MGLLGTTDYEDPSSQGMLAFALSMLAGSGTSSKRRTLGEIVGASGLQGMEQYSKRKKEQLLEEESRRRAEETAQLNKMRQMQMQRLLEAQQQEAQRRQVLQGAYQSPAQQALAGGGGPTPEAAARIPQMTGGLDLQGARQKFLQSGDFEGAALIDSLTPKPKAPIAGKPGDVYRDPETLKVLAQNPEKEDLNQMIIRGPNGQPALNPLYLQGKKDIASAGAARVSVSPQFNTGEKGFRHSVDLAQSFRQEPIYKAHQEITSAYGQIKAALEKPSGASDLAAAIMFMKLLDPRSVVRESELVMAMSTSGLLDRMANYANMVITGEKLTQKQRDEFKSMTDKLFEESRSLYNQKRLQYSAVAEKYGLDAEIIPAESVPRINIGAPVDFRKVSNEELLRMISTP